MSIWKPFEVGFVIVLQKPDWNLILKPIWCNAAVAFKGNTLFTNTAIPQHIGMMKAPKQTEIQFYDQQRVWDFEWHTERNLQ